MTEVVIECVVSGSTFTKVAKKSALVQGVFSITRLSSVIGCYAQMILPTLQQAVQQYQILCVTSRYPRTLECSGNLNFGP
jgi:hypothetical protein